MSRIFKEIIIEKKGQEFFKKLNKKIDKINKNGGYAYMTENTIRLQYKPSLLYNHRFELKYSGAYLVSYFFGVDGFEVLNYDEFIQRLEVLINDSTKKSS